MQLDLTLAAVDLEKTEKFYREILLLSPEYFHDSPADNGYLVLFVGKIKVVFQHLQEMEGQHPTLLQNLTRVPLGVGVQLEMSCEKLDVIYQKVHHYRWPIAYELEDQEHHRRELWIHDPDGYLLVLNEEK